MGAKGGPRYTPRAILEARGSRHLEQSRKDEPIVPSCKPDVPEMWKDEDWVKPWDDIAAALHEMGIMTELDSTALVLLLEALRDFETARKICEDEGMTLSTDKGTTYINPMYNVKSMAWKRLDKYLREFGLTPASRAAVKAIQQPQQGESSLDAIMKMMQGDD